METRRYQYLYAVIEPSMGDMCVEVVDTTVKSTNPNYIEIPEYNENYIMKYYNRSNGKWYTDAGFTNEWTPN